MKAAFGTWNTRIAPVFDVARQLHLVEADGGRIVDEQTETLPQDSAAGRLVRLAESGVQVLVCGAISWPMRAMVEAYGIRVIPFVAGELRQVIEAWLRGSLEANNTFDMPGGPHGRGQGQRGARNEREELGMRRSGGSAGRPGGNRPGQGRGRMGGPVAGGPGGYCVCPQCGHRQPHERGVPCSQQQCPKCGLVMRRE
jgi:predicted Fe-Mo cluster-binding NifX family protein